jgi:hypothetical protein
VLLSSTSIVFVMDSSSAVMLEVANHVLHGIPSADVEEHAILSDMKAVDPASHGRFILDQLPFEKNPRSSESMDYFVGAKHVL